MTDPVAEQISVPTGAQILEMGARGWTWEPAGPWFYINSGLLFGGCFASGYVEPASGGWRAVVTVPRSTSRIGPVRATPERASRDVAAQTLLWLGRFSDVLLAELNPSEPIVVEAGA